MRNLHFPSRSPAYGKKAMVATSHPEASRVALNFMEKGANAFDAAVSAAAILNVVEPHSTGIGGDCFCLFYSSKENKIMTLNGSGPSPKNINFNNVELDNYKNIKDDNPYSITIPGAVAAWDTILKDYGTLTFKEVLAPAITLAEKGYVVADVIADVWNREKDKLTKDSDCSKLFLKNGFPYKKGELHRQVNLAKTLDLISSYGKEGFYSGEVANDILSKINSIGGTHTREDFENISINYEEPIHSSYKGFKVLECPPNGQGIVALIMLNILSNFNLTDFAPNDYMRIHLEAEASKIGFLHRNKYLGDPKFSDIPLEKILSEEYAKSLSKKISKDKVIKDLKIEDLGNHKDTVYISVVDQFGNYVSFINSIFQPFGSGIVTPNTGVLLHNRGASFNLIKGHPNCLEPSKRPMHTIIPAMLAKDNIPKMVFGVMGAHYQPVGQVHFLTNVLDFEMDVQLALDSPRTFYYDDSLSVETTIDSETIKKLEELGHNVNYCDLPHGGGQAIMRLNNNNLIGGSDPRKDGIALGF